MYECDRGGHDAEFAVEIYEALHRRGKVLRGDIVGKRFACCLHLEDVCCDEQYSPLRFREMPQGDLIVNLRTEETYDTIGEAQESILFNMYLS